MRTTSRCEQTVGETIDTLTGQRSEKRHAPSIPRFSIGKVEYLDNPEENELVPEASEAWERASSGGF